MTQPTQGYWDCSCELYRVRCYGDTPLCDNHPDNSPFEDDELPDDDPWYAPIPDWLAHALSKKGSINARAARRASRFAPMQRVEPGELIQVEDIPYLYQLCAPPLGGGKLRALDRDACFVRAVSTLLQIPADIRCGGGGAGKGYADAGYEVMGVDNRPQKNYPFPFVQADAIEYCARYGHLFDLIHASPPCQRYSVTMPMQTKEHPDLVPTTRVALIEAGRPYVIENVPRAPLIEPVMLCGQMFGLPLYRHRLFECSFFLLAPTHTRHTIRGGGCNGTSVERATAPIMCLVGHFPGVGRAREVMGTPWMTRGEIAQAIPPAYTEFIGRAYRSQAAPA